MQTDIIKNLNISGFIEIKDKITGDILLKQSNAIHYGNMASIVARSLANSPGSFVHYMAFGNGATSIDATGQITYKTPRVIDAVDHGANMYSRTYWKTISNDVETIDRDNNFIQVINGVSYTDLKMTVTLNYNEPGDQDIFDSSTTNEGDYVFDEIALFSYPSQPNLPTSIERINTSTMLTHVIFHPVQKSANRLIEIVYIIRIQLS